MKMSFGAVLAIVFVVLKLCHVIAWSWVWVLSPLWIGFLLWLVFCNYHHNLGKEIKSRRPVFLGLVVRFSNDQ